MTSVCCLVYSHAWKPYWIHRLTTQKLAPIPLNASERLTISRGAVA